MFNKEQMETKIVSLEASVEKAEEAVETKDKELESEKSDNKELLEKVLSFNDKLNEQGKMIHELNEGLKLKELEPLLNKLVELDGTSMEPLYRLKAQSSLADDKSFEETKKFFVDRVKEKETQITSAVPTDLRVTALEAQISEKELEDDNTKAVRDKKAFVNMPKEFFKRD